MKKLCAILLLAAMLLTLTACGGKETKAVNVNLTDVMAKFSLGEELMTLTTDDLRDMYGIDAADVKQFAAAINSTGIKCDEIILIEAASSDAAARFMPGPANAMATSAPGEVSHSSYRRMAAPNGISSISSTRACSRSASSRCALSCAPSAISEGISACPPDST